MRHFYKALFATFLLPLFSYAQSNYKPGYVVTLKGDTLHGFIDYHQWDRNPKNISFKKEQDASTAEKFSISNATAFAIIGMEYYERYVLSVSQDPVDFAKLMPKTDSTIYLTDTVFLRVLNKGKYLSFYSYTDDIKQRFYLMESGESSPQELSYHGYYSKSQPDSIHYIRRYRIQLQYAAQKYVTVTNSIQKQISQANYTDYELLSIAQSINGNSSQQFTPKGLSGISWFAGAGVSYSSLKFMGYVELDGSSANSVAPKLDGGMDFFINKNIQKFYLRLEVAFVYEQYSFSNRDMGRTGGPFSTSTLSLKMYDPAIIPQFIYNIYNKEQLKIFIDVGCAVNLPFYNHYRLIKKYDTFPTVTLENYPQLTNNYFTFPLKAGFIAAKRLEIYVCYIPSTSITAPNPHTTNFQSNIASYQAGINYFIR